MKRRKIFLFLTAASAVVLWAGVMAFYYAYIKQYTTVFYIAAALSAIGVIGIIAFALLASFSGRRKYRQIWLKLYLEYLAYISEKSEQEQPDYNACLQTVRENFFADTDKYKNRVEKTNRAGEKPLLDFSVLTSGKIYYAGIVMADGKLNNFSRFIHKSYPAIVIYSEDEGFLNNPQKLAEIAVRAFKDDGLAGLVLNRSEAVLNLKICSELTDNKEIYITSLLICRRQLPFGYLKGRIIPVITDPEKFCSAFMIDCKYWTGELLNLYLSGREQKDSYGQPFDI